MFEITIIIKHEASALFIIYVHIDKLVNLLMWWIPVHNPSSKKLYNFKNVKLRCCKST